MRIRIQKERGIVALSVTLLLSAVIVEIVVIGALIAYALTSGNYSARLSAEAIAAARAGVHDAFIKIVRDKNFSANPAYTIDVGSRSADVVVCKDSKTVASACDTPSTGEREVTSVGKALAKRQKLRAVIEVDDITGESRLLSLEEIAF